MFLDLEKEFSATSEVTETEEILNADQVTNIELNLSKMLDKSKDYYKVSTHNFRNENLW